MRSRLSGALGISRSTGYYRHMLPDKDEAVRVRIEVVMKDNPAYGHERVAMALGEGTERMRRIMNQYNLRPTLRRVKHWRMPKNQDGCAPADLQNLIRDTQAEKPSHIWASDFTYIWFSGRWYYLATVLDIFTREIVGWQLGKRSKAQLVHLAYCDALSKHPPPAILHVDRGSQYTAASTKHLAAVTNTSMSYSDPGSPWQNGFQESHYGKFKLELGDLTRFEHEGELYEAIAKQVYYYNHRRIHTALRTNPVQYRKDYEQRNRPPKSKSTELLAARATE